MQKALLFSISCLSTFTSFAQVGHSDKSLATKRTNAGPARPTLTIKGRITGKAVGDDSIYFVTGGIDQKYFDGSIAPSKIAANAFTIETEASYPKMYRILMKSDMGRRVYRRGEYFVDASTSTITVDYLAEECHQVGGATAAEYQTKFIPFFYSSSGAGNCQQRKFDDFVRDEATRYDSLLCTYVKANPTSYVALWSLIERFSLFGHSQLRERILASFSKRVKASPPWHILQEDMGNVPIKQGALFPAFNVKGISQPEQPLQLPQAQYTLVDFWFSRCRPCLETFPTLKKLYAAYQAKGFEIVSISTDQTKEVPLWRNRIKEYDIPWVQYLDENAVAVEKLSINTYPTTFLLDHTGNVLLRDVPLEELEKFLAKKLGQ